MNTFLLRNLDFELQEKKILIIIRINIKITISNGIMVKFPGFSQDGLCGGEKNIELLIIIDLSITSKIVGCKIVKIIKY